ncbi:MAG: glycoside hydrolase family 25 protein [Rhizobiaceae bacterium]|nr:glycoside hydrolase family 25 protein [Rhizobiaceae bacterium]
MRSPRIALSLLLCLAMAGCTSSSGVDGLRPSSEITSSIKAEKASAETALDADGQFAARSLAGEQDTQIDGDGGDIDTVAYAAPDNPTVAKKALAIGAVQRQKFRDAKPINFGKTSPKDYAVHGVDVSRWQGEIDWVKLRSQGANFAYIKATDGGDHLDPMFKKNWKAAAQAGLKRGAYHFFYWCRSGASQADWFIRNVPKVEGALPPVIDVEWNHLSNCKKRPKPEAVREKMQAFMDKLEAHYGQRPVIYTAPDFYDDNLKGHFKNYPFWLRSVAAHPSKRYPGRDWVFWQYSGSGLSHGVKGQIDLNVFRGNEAEWRRWLGGARLVASN